VTVSYATMAGSAGFPWERVSPDRF
jgi:hypothetical protein